MPEFASKMPKIPGICWEYFFAYYAESNAGIIVLLLLVIPEVDLINFGASLFGETG